MAGLRDGISSGGGGADYTTGTFSGDVTLGDASGDTITCTGTLTVTPAATFTGGLTSNGDVNIATTKNLVMVSDSDILVNTNKFTVAGSTGNTVVAGTASVGSTLAVTGLQTNALGMQCTPVARTPTADGTGAGLIADGTSMVAIVDPSNAAYWVVLPAPTPGAIVHLLCSADATGFEIRSSAPSTVLINGGTGGAAVESAVPSTATLVRCICVSATLWICSMFDADGDEAKLPAAT